MEDQKQPAFIFRACSKQIRQSPRSCQSCKEPRRCTVRERVRDSAYIRGVRIRVGLKDFRSMLQCPSTSYLLFYSSLFPQTQAEPLAVVHHVLMVATWVLFSDVNSADVHQTLRQERGLFSSISIVPPHHNTTEKATLIPVRLFFSAMKQPLMQVPQAWSAARFNWTMSSCGCVITVWGSNRTPTRGKHEWISLRGEGIIF